MSQKQATIPIQVDFAKTLPVSCDECNNITFTDAIILRRVSKFITASKEDSMIPLQVFICTKCGHVNDEFLPDPLKQSKPE